MKSDQKHKNIQEKTTKRKIAIDKRQNIYKKRKNRNEKIEKKRENIQHI